MSNLDREAVNAFRNDTEQDAAISGLPPGYIEGFRPVLQQNLTVAIGGGITSVQGQRIDKSATILTRQMWNSPYTGGDSGFFYYVYLTREGDYKVDFTKPVYSDTEFYFAHPAFGWRVVLRLWVDPEDEIKYVSKEFRDTPRTVTVAPNGFVGEADYYCDGVNDQIWINAAIQYADEITMLRGDFYIKDDINVTESGIVVSGEGASIWMDDSDFIIGSSTVQVNNFNINGVSFKLNGPSPRTFSIKSGSRIVVDRCEFYNTSFTISVPSGGVLTFVSVNTCVFEGEGEQPSLSFSVSADLVTAAINFIGNNFRNYPVTVALLSSTANGVRFVDNSFSNGLGASLASRLFLQLVSSESLVVSGNTFENVDFITSTESYALFADDVSASIQNNSLLNSAGILVKGDGEYSLTGNTVKNPTMWASIVSDGQPPGMGYLLGTAQITDEWEDDSYNNPDGAAGFRRRPWKHFDSGQDIYLCDNSTTEDFGMTDGLDYRARVRMYVPSTSTIANITFKVQAYDGSWNDIDTVQPTVEDEYATIQLDWTADLSTYTGYRFLVDSAEEYWISTTQLSQMGYTNDGDYAFSAPETPTTELVSIVGNSWQFLDSDPDFLAVIDGGDSSTTF